MAYMDVGSYYKGRKKRKKEEGQVGVPQFDPIDPSLVKLHMII